MLKSTYKCLNISSTLDISKTIAKLPTFDNIVKQIRNNNNTNNNELSSPPSSIPKIQGWIQSMRVMKNVTFIDLTDGSTSTALKVVIPTETTKGNHNTPQKQDPVTVKALKIGQSISITNVLVNKTPNRIQDFELKFTSNSNLNIIGDILPDYPLQKKTQSVKYLRSINPIFKFKTDYFTKQLKFRSFIEYNIHSYLWKSNFIKVTPPIITRNDCEGSNNELFKIVSNTTATKKNANNDITKDVQPEDPYLTVSAQLHLETLLNSTNRTWSLIPCFRAEKSNTTRHLLEFWMLEMEFAFINDLQPLLNFIKDFIIHLTEMAMIENETLLPSYYPPEVDNKDTILKRWESLKNRTNWTTITYDKAINLLLSESRETTNFKFEPKWGNALQSEHEKFLTEKIFNGPVFVTNYPRDCKSFYMKQSSSCSSESRNTHLTVACFDLLVPGMGEIIGGSLREDDPIRLQNEMKRRGMNLNHELDWYLDLRKYGSVPHGGFGLGLERLLSYLFGNHNIRDSIPFPRSAKSQIQL
ncbi:asparagine--tRNA ligase SLM5 NDAI_0G04910 [Naumovozyma dairenensis CBS 421]|uniref:asparagine--tRNA ligase n=1 Tax=Naumovozyma dairenensis (strain ATCC 10597 / BCRC 20456 / CBS 421 / NBRC 0211 / NRRL Y-12639) TaxID=1071378 RepID=J7REE3_NAUDC|nr:hypothetical protein NDAI_0G04910 [Naumovozyma dairenensis CBS 421]CCK73474.1 hypothetical protein NDAI_0G04910 [Naumovozyma dairenensis CBS 421]